MFLNTGTHTHIRTQKGWCNLCCEQCRCEFSKTDAGVQLWYHCLICMSCCLLVSQSFGCAQTHSTLAAETVSRQGNAGMLVDLKNHASPACVPWLDLYIKLYGIMITALSWCNTRQNKTPLLVQPQNSLKWIF